MERIASFTINHLLLEPGVYVSRKDYAGEEVLTTFDLRFTKIKNLSCLLQNVLFILDQWVAEQVSISILEEHASS